MTSAALDHSPVAIDAGPVGVLLSHGFTGSPVSMRPWALELAARGHTVRVPLLPGHGTTWQEMNTTTWNDWYGAVDAALTELKGRCEHVVVAGLSMGGALALRLAEKRPDVVDGLVLVNPAIASRDKRLLALPVLHRVVASLDAIGNDIKKPGVEEGAYPRTPLRALHSQTVMWKDVRANLDAIRCPVLLLRSDDDHVVDDETQRLLQAALPAEQLETVALHDSYHVATLDHDAPVIVERSLDFIDRVTGGIDRGR